jgi:hypothetical protein
MTEQDEKKWRTLCNQAITENDPDALLHIFLELDRVMEQEQRQAKAAQSPLKTARPRMAS